MRIIIGTPSLAFKNERIRDEWFSGRLDPRLKAVILAQAAHVNHSWGYVLEITEIHRLREEQRLIYPNDPRKVSVHELWRGVDDLVREFDSNQHHELAAWTNKYFPYAKPQYKTCKHHNVGFGWHLHNQVADLGVMNALYSP